MLPSLCVGIVTYCDINMSLQNAFNAFRIILSSIAQPDFGRPSGHTSKQN